MAKLDIVEVGRHRVQITKRKGQRHIRLRVNASGEAILSLPRRYPKYLGASYLKTKKAWLDKNTFQKPLIADGCKLYTGQTLRLIENNSARNKFTQNGNYIEFQLKNPPESETSQKYMSEKIQKIYSVELAKIIVRRLDHFTEMTGLNYKDIEVKNLRSKWGSCDRNKHLKFSLYLIGFDLQLIDYVVLHELAHTKYMHHQPDFWELCKRYMPDYEQRRSQLKKARMNLI